MRDDNNLSAPARGEPMAWCPNPGWQAAFLASTATEALVHGLGANGKTWALLHAALRDTDRPDYTGLLLRGDRPGASDLVRFTNHVYRGLGARYSSTKNTWYFPSGASIEIAALPDMDSVQKRAGCEYQYIGLDFAPDFDLERYEGIMARLRSSRGIATRIRLTHTAPAEVPGWVEARWRAWLGGELADGVVALRRTCFSAGIGRTAATPPEHGPGGP